MAGHIVRALFAAAVTLLAIPANSADFSQIGRMEGEHYKSMCKTFSAGPEFLFHEDLNIDDLEDVIINSAAVSCNGVSGPECNMLGCPLRIYVQLADGTFTRVAEVRAFSFAAHYRYGAMVISFQIAGVDCGKTSLSPCTLVTRLSGTQLLVISKK
jgi:hypothetical protein